MKMLDDVLNKARDWVYDCAAGEVPDNVSDLTIAQLVSKNYDGGFCAFIASDPAWHEPTVWLFCARRFGLDVANKLFA